MHAAQKACSETAAMRKVCHKAEQKWETDTINELKKSDVALKTCEAQGANADCKRETEENEMAQKAMFDLNCAKEAREHPPKPSYNPKTVKDIHAIESCDKEYSADNNKEELSKCMWNAFHQGKEGKKTLYGF